MAISWLILDFDSHCITSKCFTWYKIISWRGGQSLLNFVCSQWDRDFIIVITLKLHSFILYHFHECYRFWTKLKQIISCYYVPSWYRSKIKNNKYIGSRVNFIFKTESNIHLSLCISLHHAYQIWKKFYVCIYLLPFYGYVCSNHSSMKNRSKSWQL